MKAHSFSFTLPITIMGILFILACGQKKVQQFTIELTQSDGSKETYTMGAGSMLQVNDGDMHVVAKVITGNKDELDLQVNRYTLTQDTMKKELTVQQSGTATNKIAMAKSSLLDPNGRVQVKLVSMAMIDTGNGPVGACKGNCCEATCFSTFCCVDPDECKNAPCDCKAPSGCPGQPSPTQTAHLFELFMSGKNMMAFKN